MFIFNTTLSFLATNGIIIDSIIDISEHLKIMIISIILLVALLACIFVINKKYKFELFSFIDWSYGMFEKVVLMVYLFAMIDEYCMRYLIYS